MKILKGTLYWLMATWSLVQIGILVQLALHLEQNILFWPLWISWSIIIVLVALLLDLYSSEGAK